MTDDIIYGKEYGERFEISDKLSDESVLEIAQGLANAHYPEGAVIEVGEDVEEYHHFTEGHRLYQYFWKHPGLPSHFHTKNDRFRLIGKTRV